MIDNFGRYSALPNLSRENEIAAFHLWLQIGNNKRMRTNTMYRTELEHRKRTYKE